MNDINKKEKGTEYEGIAVRYLLENNYEILATNFVCKHGEIDIVARDIQDDYIVFIEVKYRSNNRFGMPQESVDIRKQQRIIYSSRVYIYKNKSPMKINFHRAPYL